MNIPDFLPVLSAGAHDSPAAGACFMEWASILAGEKFSDDPACTNPVLAALARAVNDRLPDPERHQIAHLIPSVIGTAHPEPLSIDAKVVNVRLAAFLARQVEHLNPDPRVVAAIEAAEAWAAHPDRPTARTARTAAYAAAYATDAAAAYAAAYATDAAAAYAAAYVAAYATDAAAAYAAAYATDAAAAYVAANAATAAADAAVGGVNPSLLVHLLEAGIAEHARLTGHKPADIDTSRWTLAQKLVKH